MLREILGPPVGLPTNDERSRGPIVMATADQAYEVASPGLPTHFFGTIGLHSSGLVVQCCQVN